MYMGDDIPDLEVLKYVDLVVAHLTHHMTYKICDYISIKKGEGCP